VSFSVGVAVHIPISPEGFIVSLENQTPQVTVGEV
jgi:hypothetical protein